MTDERQDEVSEFNPGGLPGVDGMGPAITEFTTPHVIIRLPLPENEALMNHSFHDKA